jgi:hypothetical protein
MRDGARRLTDAVTARKARDRLDAEVGAVDYRPEAPPPEPIATDDAVPATGIVVRFRETATVVGIHPVVEVDLVILAPNSVPRPLHLQLEVSVDQVPLLQRGATLAVTLSRLDRARGAIAWERTARP